MNYSRLLKYNNAVLYPKNAVARRKLKKNMVSFYYLEPERIEILKYAKSILQTGTILLHPIEICQLAMLVKNTSKIRGDIAEVGVYKGGSASVICKYKNDRTVHLIDTFKGLPKTQPEDKNLISNISYNEGQYKASLVMVKKLLSQYNDVYIYKGKFPENSQNLEGKKFSFVHLDLDIYESTIGCLRFFYPRMNKGGVIITHDYQNAFGVRKAFDEFFMNKPEIIIELACTQAMVVVL